MWLFLAFVLVPIIEIALFIEVGGAIGTWWTLAIVITTALAGSILLRSQGVATVNRLRSSISQGQNPVNPIAHGAFLLISGVLLLTPGFFTDVVGLSLLLPPVRETLIKFFASRMAGNIHVSTGDMGAGMGGPGTGPTSQPRNPSTIDGDYTVVDEADEATPGNSKWTTGPR